MAEHELAHHPGGYLFDPEIDEDTKAVMRRRDAQDNACAGLTTAKLEALGPGGVKKLIALVNDFASYIGPHFDLSNEAKALLDRLDAAKEKADASDKA